MATVGVPVMIPLEVLNVRPAGSAGSTAYESTAPPVDVGVLAAMATPDASAAIHEAVLAIRTRTTLDVLADTIHAFPTLARVMGDLFAEVATDF